MTRVSILTAAAVGVLLVGVSPGAGLKSGIPVGDSIRSFNPQHVTGPDAGKSACLV